VIEFAPIPAGEALADTMRMSGPIEPPEAERGPLSLSCPNPSCNAVIFKNVTSDWVKARYKAIQCYVCGRAFTIS
jgi:hypothetical protein